jgi:hypothetical protein
MRADWYGFLIIQSRETVFEEVRMQHIDHHQNDLSSVLVNGLKGAIAGAVGVWVMDRVDWFNFEHEDPEARRQTERVRPDGLDPAHVAVQRVAGATSAEITPAQPNAAGVGVHYALGIGPSALYGAFRDRLPVQTEGQDFLYGAAMGLGLFLVQDEGLNALTGLSARPRQYPWQAHARGLAAHLVFGVVTNAVLNVLDAPRPVPRISRTYQQVAADDFGGFDYERPLPMTRGEEPAGFTSPDQQG